MSKTNGKVPQLIEIVEEEAKSASSSVRSVFLAGLGLISLSQEKFDGLQSRVEETYADLVERGESLDKDGRKMISEITQRRRSQAKDANEKVENEFERRMEALLVRLNVPTRDDIKELNTKLNSLNRKVDELRKAREVRPTAA